MKLKIDFVTNSSSASFTILKSDLTHDQIEMIHDHINIAKIIAESKGYAINSYDIKDKLIFYLDSWNITETLDKIEGDTMIDNFDMLQFLQWIGVKEEAVVYESD